MVKWENWLKQWIKRGWYYKSRTNLEHKHHSPVILTGPQDHSESITKGKHKELQKSVSVRKRHAICLREGAHFATML